MNLPTEIFDDVIVVHTPEDLGSEQVDGFEACVSRLERKNVVLDLDDTESLDSRGLTALLDVQEKLRAAQGDVKVAVTCPAIRKILEITRLDQHLEVFDSVVDAVKSYR
jgi:anti-sigma B factor antagonist